MTLASDADGGSRHDRVPAAYAVLDRLDGQVLEVNEAFVRLLGHPRATLLAGSLSDLLSLAGRIYSETHLMPMLDLNGHVEEVALDVVATDGARIPVLMNAVLDRTGERATIRVVLFGALERRRYETELLRATRAAQKARAQADELARTLQQTLIPPVPPVIPRLEVSAVYRPAGDGDEVGGDFYDVFSIAPSTWVVVLGDVAGKGVHAATVTAFIRHTVRDLAMQLADPADLLHALDRALHARPTERFCSAVLLRLTEGDAGWSIAGAAAGHPLPILGRRDGTLVDLGRPGSLIGLVDDPHFTTFTHRLAPDEFVTLLTDGVTEARRDRELFGEDAVRDVVRSRASNPDGVSAGVVAAAIDYQRGFPHDDIAVLTLYPSAPDGTVR
ncbi:SpoIIE family protein phosphatase [Nocardioides dongxiaopingii]|uniref:PP2C family protein-serine/threonine phosphatase n=1 Tax=Nocardioides sp. S-1144 TaxID=2582905 RepID=UPI001164C470|nr:SpoIIE family protein phosphatase [Nocardioides sp. S-1144]QCW49396.2 SpoIIE family protein phosphatase [Nocardioides sp. S-1144]